MNRLMNFTAPRFSLCHLALAGLGAFAACEDDPTPESASYELCIHSNAAGEAGDDLTAGHAWLTIHDGTTGNMVASYGMWPDSHPGIQAAGLDNGDATDVRKNYSGDMRLGTYYYCECITAAQKTQLEELAAANRGWCVTDNCSSFASDAFASVTGTDVDADDEGGLGTETPRELGDSIKALNGGTNTPSGVAGGDDSSSTSSGE